MMDLRTFVSWALQQRTVAKYNDGQFSGECVSLINQYCYRVLNVPADAWGDAKDWATNAMPLKYFDVVSDVQAGDILVYDGTRNNPAGHIEIALANGFALGQNRALDRLIRQQPIMPGYAHIIRLKKQEEVDMKISPYVAERLYPLTYHRQPESEQAWRGWIGGDMEKWIDNAMSNGSEWHTENDILLRIYPQLLKDFQAVKDQSDVLARRPTEENFKLLQSTISTLNDKIAQLQIEHDELVKEKVESQKTGNAILRFISDWWNGKKS